MLPSHRSALVVAACPEGLITQLPRADIVIAADSGVDTIRRLDGRVDILVGDLDSVSSEGLAWARSQRARILRYPVRKDATDMELALRIAADRAESVHVLASAGGRLDHAVANLLVLASRRWAGVRLSATVDSAHVDVIRGRCRLGGEVGDRLSLLAIGGPARIARTRGLEYPCVDEVLSPTSARGVSNVIIDVPPTVEVRSGVVLAIRPDYPRDTNS